MKVSLIRSKYRTLPFHGVKEPQHVLESLLVYFFLVCFQETSLFTLRSLVFPPLLTVAAAPTAMFLPLCYVGKILDLPVFSRYSLSATRLRGLFGPVVYSCLSCYILPSQTPKPH